MCTFIKWAALLALFPGSRAKPLQPRSARCRSASSTPSPPPTRRCAHTILPHRFCRERAAETRGRLRGPFREAIGIGFGAGS